MESVSSHEAHKFFNTSQYLYQLSQTCYNKCVVDFQIADVGPMERDCAKACIAKHMIIYKDLLK